MNLGVFSENRVDVSDVRTSDVGIADTLSCTVSICVVTMNRSAQLKEALESCLQCSLPTKTEFIIIDNASTDNTEQTVKCVLSDSKYPYYYEKLPENLGVGGGRNYAFSKANGKYIYMLDDDAVIDVQKNPDFFQKSIQILDSHEKIVTLTTQIYDTAWKTNRIEKSGPELEPGICYCKMFCGGSHFLRKSFFEGLPYLPNKYGYEEIPPSLRVMDAGCINAFCPELLVIHKPMVNKWDWTDEKNQNLLIHGIAAPYVIMKMMYPPMCIPLLWVAAQIRFIRCLRKLPNARKRYDDVIQSLCTEYAFLERIHLCTVWRMLRYFGLSTF